MYYIVNVLLAIDKANSTTEGGPWTVNIVWSWEMEFYNKIPPAMPVKL